MIAQFVTWLSGFFDQGSPQSSARLVAIGCLFGMLAIVVADDVVALAYAWAIYTGRASHDPSTMLAATSPIILGLAVGAREALKARTTTSTEGLTGTPDTPPVPPTKE